MFICSFIFLFIREYTASFFIKNDPVALSLTSEYMFYLLIGLPLMAIFQTFMGTFNGTGDTKFTFILTVTRLWVLRIPLVILMKSFSDLGPSGIWYAMLFSNLLIIPVAMVMYRRIDYQPKVSVERKKNLKYA